MFRSAWLSRGITKYHLLLLADCSGESWIGFLISEKEKEFISEATNGDLELCEFEEFSEIFHHVSEAVKEKE